ncbi:MAG: acyloxyacyl hydrolase, partial [Edaphobacter sp.]
MTKRFCGIARPSLWALALVLSVSLFAIRPAAAQAQAVNPDATPFHANSGKLPLELGVLVQSGVGLTEDRSSFKFLMAGVHAGKVLTGNYLPGPLHGNFEYAVEVFPFWQSYTPKFQRAQCTAVTGSPDLSCSPLYTVGGTFSGVSVTPIILRWNFTGTRRISPWVQGA